MSLAPDTLSALRERLESALLLRAETDVNFRSRLLSEPHGALEALLGKDPVPSLKIRVLEEAEGEAILVLPRLPLADELPDDLLDMASGGFASPFAPDFSSICPPK